MYFLGSTMTVCFVLVVKYLTISCAKEAIYMRQNNILISYKYVSEKFGINHGWNRMRVFGRRVLANRRYQLNKSIVCRRKLKNLGQLCPVPARSAYEPRHDKTNKMSVRPAKTQISLGIRPIWSESSLCAQYVAKDPSFLHADSEDSDQTGRMPRLIWVFARRTLILLVLSCRGSYECKQSPAT